MFFLPKKMVFLIATHCLIFAYTLNATTKLKLVNKTNKTISVELFRITKNEKSKELKLERLQKSAVTHNKEFTKQKLLNNHTYMIKVLSDWDSLRRLTKDAQKKYTHDEHGEEYLMGLDASVMAQEHYFIVKTLKNQIIHIDFSFDEDSSENPAYSMRKTKKNTAQGSIQYGTSFENKDIKSKFDSLLLQTKICFFYDENIKEIMILTNQLMTEFKQQMLLAKNEMNDLKDEIAKITKKELEVRQQTINEKDDLDDGTLKNNEEEKIVKKASMRMLLQDNFNSKTANTTYNAVLAELMQKNLPAQEREKEKD